MRRMLEIEAENGEVKSIDGNVIPVTKLYNHYIVLNDGATNKCYAFLVDDNPNSYKNVSLREKHPNLTIPCYGQKIEGGKVYQYVDLIIDPNVGYGLQFTDANLETNRVDRYTTWAYGSVVKSDTVTPLN